MGELVKWRPCSKQSQFRLNYHLNGGEDYRERHAWGNTWGTLTLVILVANQHLGDWLAGS